MHWALDTNISWLVLFSVLIRFDPPILYYIYIYIYIYMYEYILISILKPLQKYGGSKNIAAISKKSKAKGRQIEGQDEGYIDMEFDEDDDVDSMGFPIKKDDDDDDDDDDKK